MAALSLDGVNTLRQRSVHNGAGTSGSQTDMNFYYAAAAVVLAGIGIYLVVDEEDDDDVRARGSGNGPPRAAVGAAVTERIRSQYAVP